MRAVGRQAGSNSSGRARVPRLAAAATALLLAAAGLTQPSVAHAEGRDYFAVPDAALVRSLGDIAEGSCAPAPKAQACDGETPSAIDAAKGNFPLSVPGLGIPLGGAGAGAFMVNQSGTFGPWNFGGQQGSSWETRTLPQAAFHVREQVGADAATVRTLATDGPTDVGSKGTVKPRTWGSPLPGWDTLKMGDADYAALYPFGWMSYKPFKTDVSMRFFSPIVAGEDRRTSLPVAYFDVRLANHTSARSALSVMFTMPNAPAHVDGTQTDPTAGTPPTSVRKGFSSTHTKDRGVESVTLRADDPANTPDEQRSDWTIATKAAAGQQVSYVTSWNGEGDGSDIYAAFKTGKLPNAALDGSSSAGAINVSVSLAPGEVRTIPFVLTWDFPQVGFANNQTVWMKRYTNFYGAKTTSTNDYIAGSYPGFQSANIARDAALDHDNALTAVQRWWSPIATEASYPRLMRTAALNQLTTLFFNNTFWEGGLVRNSVTPTGFSSAGTGNHINAARPDSHLFGIQDTGAGGQSGMGTTWDIQAYNYLLYFKLFPNLFRDTLSANIRTTALSTNGNAHDLYRDVPSGDPFITWENAQDAPVQGAVDSRPPLPGRTQWLDSPSKYVMQWYAYAKLNNDPGLLREAWPAMKKQIAFLRGTILPGTHLPTDPGTFANIYNGFPQTGQGIYDSQLYLLALTATVATGDQLQVEPGYIAGLRAELAAAKTQFELSFWNPAEGFYRLSTVGPLSEHRLADSFFAQHIAEDLGLPDLIDQDRHEQQLLAQRDSSVRYNAANELTGVEAANTSVPGVGLGGIWAPSAYTSAADYIQTAGRTGRPELKQFGLDVALAIADQIWNQPSSGFAFDAPQFWSNDSTDNYTYPAYSQLLSVWEVLDAIKPLTQVPGPTS